VEQTQNIISPLIFNDAQKEQIESLVHGLNDRQLLWLAGYLTGISQSATQIPAPAKLPVNGITISPTFNVDLPDLTILYGSRTGNGAAVARKLQEKAESKGYKIHLHDMNEYPLNKLKDEKYLLIIVSTHGEGVPPVAAEEFYEYIHGKRAPQLDGTKFSVLALGDKSYLHFCKTGIDVDKRLEELGARRIHPRFDCDVDFSSVANQWIEGLLSNLSNSDTKTPLVKLNGNHSPRVPEIKSVIYDRQNPFKARLIEKIKLNGKGSSKETFHYELSLAGSGITYEPGDSLGIYGANSDRLVYELVDALKLNPGEEIEYNKTKDTLGNILSKHFEISTINPQVLKSYNEFAQSIKLQEILDDNDKLKAFVYGSDWVDVVNEFPVKLSSSELLSVLHKLQPRLYSIASSLKANPGEVHLAIAAVRYVNNRYKEGTCSTYLSDRMGDKDAVMVFSEKNPDFRLPSDPNTPIIMVGPGTGIAPFRAFLQERETLLSKGKNWLFFGDRHFTTDFLYQTELQSWHKKKLLTNLHIAFSRDTEQKTYVQHKMQEHAKELYQWIEEGAHFYVCGDKKSMWIDVNRTLTNIIAKEGRISLVKAEEYVKKLKKAKRYQTDVY
jgi:sulfite reductase (NADPH) flavoprotein alpha-component